MLTAVFYGASDDLVEVEGVKGSDEFACGWHPSNHRGPGVVAQFNLGGRLRVFAIYDGCWSFAAAQVDEEIPLPEWPIRVRQSTDTPYSTRLEIDVPDDVKVFREDLRR